MKQRTLRTLKTIKDGDDSNVDGMEDPFLNDSEVEKDWADCNTVDYALLVAVKQQVLIDLVGPCTVHLPRDQMTVSHILAK